MRRLMRLERTVSTLSRMISIACSDVAGPEKSAFPLFLRLRFGIEDGRARTLEEVGKEFNVTRERIRQIEAKGSFDLSGRSGSDGGEFAKVGQFGFESGKSTHADRIQTIRFVEKTFGITIDTHTADGVKVAREHQQPGVPMIVLETAQAAKFNETINEALGRDADRPAGFEHLEELPQRFTVMPVDAVEVKQYIAGKTGL